VLVAMVSHAQHYLGSKAPDETCWF